MFLIDAGETRRELCIRMRFLGGGGLGGWRVRILRPALLDTFIIAGPPLRFLGCCAGQAPIFSRAGISALCGLWSLDLKLFGVHL
jgi:hypothetical protein